MNPSSVTVASRHFALLPAAGVGSRVGAERPKQYLRLGDATVLERAVRPFLASSWIDAVLVVVARGDAVAATLPGLRDARVAIAAIGGATRRDTVLAGLRRLAEMHGARPDDWVHVHDAARPGIDTASLERLRAALADERIGGLLALPVADTVKRGRAGRSEQTVDRDGLWLAQTPQTFRHHALLQALERHDRVTDEAAALEAGGHRPVLVEGSRRNFKITTRDDLELMRALLAPEPE